MRPYRFFAVTVILLALTQTARASEEKHEKKAEKGGHEGGGEHGAAEEKPKTPEFKRSPGGYLHNWTALPPVEGQLLGSNDVYSYKPKLGQATVVIFIASWCEPCQNLTPQIAALQKKYEDVDTAFLYIFSHDTMADAVQFAKEHQLKGHLLLANHEILKAYHNPQLPAIYLADRHGYLSYRSLDMRSAALKEIESRLGLLTAF